MHKMAVPEGSCHTRYARDFAKELHDRWGVGNKACNNGVLLLLSTEDRQVPPPPQHTHSLHTSKGTAATGTSPCTRVLLRRRCAEVQGNGLSCFQHRVGCLLCS
jgi:TPM domain